LGVLKEAVGEAFNLASETETRVIDLANWINELTGNKAGLVFRVRRDWDKVVKRRASIEKARRILGYRPKVDIKTGLQKTHDWIFGNRAKIEAAVAF
jgi:nucleoside-diphosphate-sugar epimerase